ISLRFAGGHLYLSSRHKIKVEFWTHIFKRVREAQCRRFNASLRLDCRFGQGSQYRRIVARTDRKAFLNHDGSKILIENCRAESVLEAADKHRFIDERVLWPAQTAPFRAERRPPGWRRTRHD